MIDKELIKEVQRFLNIPVTGILDPFTNAAIRNFQQKELLLASGELDDITLKQMGLGGWHPPMKYPEGEGVTDPIDIGDVPDQGDLDTDDRERYELPIIEQYLKKYSVINGKKVTNYYNGPTPKEYIFLHHTAGWNNPFGVVDDWSNDQRGAVGTHYVIGGINPKTNDDQFDGVIVKCMDDEWFAWHLGIGNNEVHRNSIGIELCNFGYLTKGGYKHPKTGKWIPKDPNGFYTWVGVQVPTNQICDLEYEFRGFRYYHKYTDKQLISLRFLIEEIGKRHGIDIKKGLVERLKNSHPMNAFDYDPDIKKGHTKGMFCHTNVSGPNKYGFYEKFDLSPQPDLIDLLTSL